MLAIAEDIIFSLPAGEFLPQLYVNFHPLMRTQMSFLSTRF